MISFFHQLVVDGGEEKNCTPFRLTFALQLGSRSSFRATCGPICTRHIFAPSFASPPSRSSAEMVLLKFTSALATALRAGAPLSARVAAAAPALAPRAAARALAADAAAAGSGAASGGAGVAYTVEEFEPAAGGAGAPVRRAQAVVRGIRGHTKKMNPIARQVRWTWRLPCSPDPPIFRHLYIGLPVCFLLQWRRRCSVRDNRACLRVALAPPPSARRLELLMRQNDRRTALPTATSAAEKMLSYWL
jgi:hypothetical protein